MTEQRIGAGGEEWWGMEEAVRAYDPAASADVLREANENIERFRKGDATLRVTDAAGDPVAGAELEVVQQRHDFPFGNQLWALDRLYRDGRWTHDRAVYLRKRFAEVFNAANALCYWTERPRNDGPKTEDIQGFPRLDGFHACVDWAAGEGLHVKAHPLFWSIQKCVPDWLKRYDYATQMTFAEVRVRQIIAGVRGKVSMYDIVNEALWEPAFKNLARRDWPHIDPICDLADYIDPVLRWARDEDPDARYVLNDYGLTSGKEVSASDGSTVTDATQRKRMLQLVAELGDRGNAPCALGLQSHTGGWTDHNKQWQVYEELSQAGLPIHITEFWASTKSLRAEGKLDDETIDRMQSDYVENFLTVAFGHPSVEAFFFWGGRTIEWRDEITSGHVLTDIYHRLRGIIHDRWSTRETLKTDEQGRASFRGFFGDYAARMQLPAGAKRGLRFRLSKQNPGEIVLTLPTRLRP